MALSVAAINAAKCCGNACKISESQGLYLLITPAGARYSRMNYRITKADDAGIRRLARHWSCRRLGELRFAEMVVAQATASACRSP